jgi:hypothetical protein
MYEPSAPHLMITQPILSRPTPISRNLSVASSIDSFEGGSGSDKSDKASSAFGLKIDIDLRTDVSSSSSSGATNL